MHITNRLPRETGRDYALRTLKENIISMELEPGSMVSENELSTAMGVSRTPVREALIELSKVNIVEIYPQKGSRIALISADMVGQAYFMRETLECEVIRQICACATEENLDELRASIREQERFLQRSTPDLENGMDRSFLELDNQFHERLYQIAGKALVYRITQEIMIHFDRMRQLSINYIKPETLVAQHKDILKAVEDKDDLLSAALVRKHLGHFRGIEAALKEQYPNYFEGV